MVLFVIGILFNKIRFASKMLQKNDEIELNTLISLYIVFISVTSK